MAIGGFNNEGGNLTLAQFKQYVARGEIHYYIATSNGGGGGGPVQATAGAAIGVRHSGGGARRTGSLPSAGTSGARPAGGGAGARPGGAPGGLGGSSSSAITSWVKAHFKSVTVGGQTVYDLTQARA
jgi:hypothetical protein